MDSQTYDFAIATRIDQKIYRQFERDMLVHNLSPAELLRLIVEYYYSASAL
jgi:hypothetical protein